MYRTRSILRSGLNNIEEVQYILIMLRTNHFYFNTQYFTFLKHLKQNTDQKVLCSEGFSKPIFLNL